MTLHPGNQMRLFDEGHASIFQRRMHPANICHAKVQNRALTRERFVRSTDQEPDRSALKKGHCASVKKELHAEGVLIEIPGPRQIANRQGDLPNLTEMNCRLGIRHIAAHLLLRGEASLAEPTAHDSNTVIPKPCKKKLPKAR
jgi:hypothetical protein